MESLIETERLLLRPLKKGDAHGMFLLDSNPNVHQYLGKNPVTDIEQSKKAIALIQQQYRHNGVGRWAVIEKSSLEFLGWSGLKLDSNVNGRAIFYDFGYRLREEYWGSGYATEAGKAWIDYGFRQMKLSVINAYVSAANIGSRKVLEKCGLRHIEDFEYEGGPECWYEIRNPKFD